MSFRVIYSSDARQDLIDIYRYIADELLAPETAIGQVRRIVERIRALNELPLRFRLYDKEPWQSAGMRFFPVDNYLVFYVPDESKNTVAVLRIIYGGMNINEQLNETIRQP